MRAMLRAANPKRFPATAREDVADRAATETAADVLVRTVAAVRETVEIAAAALIAPRILTAPAARPTACKAVDAAVFPCAIAEAVAFPSMGANAAFAARTAATNAARAWTIAVALVLILDRTLPAPRPTSNTAADVRSADLDLAAVVPAMSAANDPVARFVERPLVTPEINVSNRKTPDDFAIATARADKELPIPARGKIDADALPTSEARAAGCVRRDAADALALAASEFPIPTRLLAAAIVRAVNRVVSCGRPRADPAARAKMAADNVNNWRDRAPELA